MTLDEFLKSAEALPLVPPTAAAAYQDAARPLASFVDATLSYHPGIDELIGHQPLQVMFDNHRHHAALMATVFSIGGYGLLAKTMIWVYRAYTAHGFSLDYFPLALPTWIQAVEKHLEPEDVPAIKAVYQWMIAHHQDAIELASSEISIEPPMDRDWVDKRNRFLHGLLEGDHQTCLSVATVEEMTPLEVEKLYLHIIQPAMYDVGRLWEKSEISVAQEHLASAIVARILASIAQQCRSSAARTGRAIITASPNEYHEIGAWMVSDMLAQDGWDVRYLGADTPIDDLRRLARDFRPDLLCVSVTVAFNFNKAKSVIAAIKNDNELKHIKVLIGGRTFIENPELRDLAGADAFAANAASARDLARQWKPEPNEAQSH